MINIQELELEQVFVLRDISEECLNTTMFRGDNAYREMYIEADEYISLTAGYHVEWV